MHDARSGLERLLSRISPVRAGEGRAVALLFAQVFTILFAYSLIKPVREALILGEQGAEVRSYALAAQALALMVLIPVYTAVLRRIFPHYHLVPWITVFLAANLAVFIVLGAAGVNIGVPFFIWLGVFNVLIVAQFWAFAADVLSVESGERLFVLAALGASLGAWVGSEAARLLFPLLGPFALMAVAAALLLITAPLIPWTRAAVPAESRPTAGSESASGRELRGLLGGFRIVVTHRHLRLLAVFMVLLNCINSTGEYLLASLARDHALATVGAADAGRWLGGFYSEQIAWVNRLGLLIQLLLVARLFRWIGVPGATAVLPLVAFAGYGLLAFVPVFGLLRLVKVAENSINYSLQNTARHALILPMDEDAKYAGKTTVDTFFWRLGDLLQAAIVWVGVTVLAAAPAAFAVVNVLLSGVWLFVALQLGDSYRRLTGEPALSAAR